MLNLVWERLYCPFFYSFSSASSFEDPFFLYFDFLTMYIYIDFSVEKYIEISRNKLC